MGQIFSRKKGKPGGGPRGFVKRAQFFRLFFRTTSLIWRSQNTKRETLGRCPCARWAENFPPQSIRSSLPPIISESDTLNNWIEIIMYPVWTDDCDDWRHHIQANPGRLVMGRKFGALGNALAESEEKTEGWNWIITFFICSIFVSRQNTSWKADT